MQQSEYQTQAYVYDGLNQQNGLDSLEGSAALSRPNKPGVDGTDIQKQQILAKTGNKQAVVHSLKTENQRHRSPNRTTKTAKYKKT